MLYYYYYILGLFYLVLKCLSECISWGGFQFVIVSFLNDVNHFLLSVADRILDVLVGLRIGDTVTDTLKKKKNAIKNKVLMQTQSQKIVYDVRFCLSQGQK